MSSTILVRQSSMFLVSLILDIVMLRKAWLCRCWRKKRLKMNDDCSVVLQALVFMIFGGSQVANHNLGLF